MYKKYFVFQRGNALHGIRVHVRYKKKKCISPLIVNTGVHVKFSTNFAGPSTMLVFTNEQFYNSSSAKHFFGGPNFNSLRRTVKNSKKKCYFKNG